MVRFHATSEGLTPFTPEEEAERDAEEASWIADKKSREAIDIRKIRDKLLTNSDWVVVKSFESGAAVDPDWIKYRQLLRDMPQQSGFPEDVVWPQKPQ